MRQRSWLPLLLVDGALLLASPALATPRGAFLGLLAVALVFGLRGIVVLQRGQVLALGVAFITAGLLLDPAPPVVFVPFLGGLLMLYDVLFATYRMTEGNTVAFGSAGRPHERIAVAGAGAFGVALVLFDHDTAAVLPAVPLAALMVALALERVRRHAVLGVFERLERSLQLVAVAIFGTLLAAIIDPSLAWYILIATLLFTQFLVKTDKLDRVMPVSRTVALEFIYGAPMAAIAWYIFSFRNALLGGVAVGVVSLVAAIAAILRERTFLDDGGKFLTALEDARKDLHQSETASALTTTFVVLKRAAPPEDRSSPRIYSFSERVWRSVDTAGYPTRTEEDAPPEELLARVRQEPFLVLRREALSSMEVRQQEARTHLQWFDSRNVWLAALLKHGDIEEGLMLVPVWNRTHPLIVEEAHALHRLTTELAWLEHAAGGARAGLVREQKKEEEKVRVMGEREEATSRLERAKAREELALSRIGRLANFAQYSLAMRDAHTNALALLRTRRSFCIVASSGTRAVDALAAMRVEIGQGHLPFVVVDTAYPEEIEERRFLDPIRSPLALAESGHLVVLGRGSFSARVREVFTGYLNAARLPFPSPDRPTIVFVSPHAFEEGSLDLDLTEPLVSVVWPRIEARGEDLRTLLLDELARRGIRDRGTPLGLNDDAFAKVLEANFAADELHIETLAVILAEITQGNVVDRSAMESALAKLDLRAKE